ncbi:hypothetical protein CSKR_203969 [Clonorchis sinensis]|uniref:Uncharacterized protein n=1 Tax=Clonorchis sinensis TaxID=79923 RepID=A0A8T1MNE5_CLOSI|nr:hypothetical protein CSKR_203969 [Clonorchis sinensis]
MWTIHMHQILHIPLRFFSLSLSHTHTRTLCILFFDALRKQSDCLHSYVVIVARFTYQSPFFYSVLVRKLANHSCTATFIGRHPPPPPCICPVSSCAASPLSISSGCFLMYGYHTTEHIHQFYWTRSTSLFVLPFTVLIPLGF